MLFLPLLTAPVALLSSGSAAFTMQSHFLVAGLTVAVLPSLISAANSVRFVNHCPYDLYSWTVGPAGSGYEGKDYEAVTILANSVTVHGMVNGEAIGGGIALKLRDLPKYQVTPAGIIQVEYNLEPSKNNIWYDLSAIDCKRDAGPENMSFCPLIGGGVGVSVENADYETCPPASCGADGCHNTYEKPGSWKGEPTFRCGAGVDVVVEFCTERAGPRTIDGQTEPGHPADPYSDTKPGEPTTNGVCGARTPGGATCFGYAHGNCCSSYGWCGFSEAHCGEGCQSGFGDCFGQPPAQPPAKPSTVEPSYSKPLATSTYVKPTPSYYPPPSSYTQPKHTHIEHTWPSFSKPTSSYAKPSMVKSTPVYSKPMSSYVMPTPSYYPPASSYVKPTPSYSKFTPVYSQPTPVYGAPYYPPVSSYRPPVKTSHSSMYMPAPSHSKPTPVSSRPTPSYATPSHNKPTPSYSAPTHSMPPGYTPPAPTPEFSPPYSPPPYRTIYATHTVTETRAQMIKTVTVSNWYHVPAAPSVYHTPTPMPPVYHSPTYLHTPQQEPHIPSSWYDRPGPSSLYYAPTPATAYYPPVQSETVYYPPARA